MNAKEKEILWSILDDYYSDDENVDTFEISRTLVETIAKMIGFGRATLYRALDKLEKSGTLTKIDKKIIFNEV